MIFKLVKVYLSLDIEKIKTLILNPEFWEDAVEAKRIKVTRNNSSLHQDMLIETEIDSLGVIKRDIDTIQDIHFAFEEPYFDEKESCNAQKIVISVENSNQLNYFDALIKIEEKPGKARLTFILEKISLKAFLVELIGTTLANRRLKREIRKIMDKVAVYIENGQIDKYIKK